MTDKKQITDDRSVEKIVEAKKALRGSQSNIETIIRHNGRLEALALDAGSALRILAEKCGDLRIQEGHGGNAQFPTLKSELQHIAENLTKELPR